MKRTLVILFLSLSCHAFAAGLQLGKIDFPTSGSAKAQPAFLQGVLWLHSFEYEEARSAFQQAEKADPGFAMAYWGEAMTYDHPVWTQQDLDAARAALNKLAPTPEGRQAKAKTQREKDYLAAIEVLYGKGEKRDRDAAYSAAMQKLHEKYPNDQDAACFYSLSLLGMCEGKRDYAIYGKAAKVAEEVFVKNPLHPGAAHYLIHSYDDPEHAKLGLPAAEAYARIAPAATHALHMPSHIFLALGLWNKVVASNQESWEASHHNSYHAMHWLEYGYLQLGQFDEARKLLDQIHAAAAKSGPMNARMHLALMRAAYLIETQKWKDKAVSIQVDTSDFDEDQSITGADLFATGYAYLKTGDVDGADKILASFSEKVKEGKGHSQTKMYGMSYHDMNSELTSAGISRSELEASILFARGKKDDALKLMADAAAKEDAMTYDFGPPVPVKPTHELYGEMLLMMGRKPEARQQFELALKHAPGRRLSKEGLDKSNQ